MERLPSKTALFLTSALNFTSLCLLLIFVTSMARVIWPGWIGNTVFVVGWLYLLVSFGFYLTRLSLHKSRLARWNELRRQVGREEKLADIWQWQWIDRAEKFGFKPGEEWRPLQAMVLSFVVLCFMILFDAWKYPEFAPNLRSSWSINFVMSILMASMLNVFSVGFAKPQRRSRPPSNYDGPDDYGPAAMGARVRPPSPTSLVGNGFPSDRE